MKDLKVIFMGTPLFAVPVLEYLIKNTNLVLVITKKDTYEGRKRVLTYSPVKKCALENSRVPAGFLRAYPEAPDDPAYPNMRRGAAPMKQAAAHCFGELAVEA